jgi:hypothetical protein
MLKQSLKALDAISKAAKTKNAADAFKGGVESAKALKALVKTAKKKKKKKVAREEVDDEDEDE